MKNFQASLQYSALGRNPAQCSTGQSHLPTSYDVSQSTNYSQYSQHVHQRVNHSAHASFAQNSGYCRNLNGYSQFYQDSSNAFR